MINVDSVRAFCHRSEIRIPALNQVGLAVNLRGDTHGYSLRYSDYWYVPYSLSNEYIYTQKVKPRVLPALFPKTPKSEKFSNTQ
jgi:hypothetical protein